MISIWWALLMCFATAALVMIATAMLVSGGLADDEMDREARDRHHNIERMKK